MTESHRSVINVKLGCVWIKFIIPTFHLSLLKAIKQGTAGSWLFVVEVRHICLLFDQRHWLFVAKNLSIFVFVQQGGN